jgi:hypothetical protein
VDHGIIARLAKEARAARLAHVTATSLKVFLLSPVFGKRPKLLRKGTAAALTLRTAQYQALPCISDPRTRECTGFGAGCWLLLGCAMGPRSTCRREAGVAWCQWPRGAWVLVPSPHHVLLPRFFLPGLQEGQGLQIGLLVAPGECHGAEVRVSR